MDPVVAKVPRLNLKGLVRPLTVRTKTWLARASVATFSSLSPRSTNPMRSPVCLSQTKSAVFSFRQRRWPHIFLSQKNSLFIAKLFYDFMVENTLWANIVFIVSKAATTRQDQKSCPLIFIKRNVIICCW